MFASYSYRLNQVLRDNFLLDSTTDKIIEIYLIVNTVKPVYNSQPRGITEVTFVRSVRYPIFTGGIKTGLSGQETATHR